ncbi:hypothetical protein M409DRAFT_26724 [Zasmidium cellare ATCC 36951]|uniref:Uncharacterized protein n=1 Tax=Zasmidium cellare ATCC 36951 TaxID=1080233 RepID=A0A6A6CB39_ZASCE|nr:uncharacterized protein M409DRAFT_26724 [Zasmidium cellare ATCC 36951]KAF2162869.1 hypothetical protein M409DRAFT_26724 [Zasmidium cellare ATCC 36951]
MHTPTWLIIAKQQLSCKNITKLRKPRPIEEETEQHDEPGQNDESAYHNKTDWTHVAHDLSTIFEAAEPLADDNTTSSSRSTSTLFSDSENTPWSLLYDPAIFTLCSSSTAFTDADAGTVHEVRDPRASSKIPISDDDFPSYMVEPSGSPIHIPLTPTLQSTLTATRHDLAYTSAALDHAHDELEYFRFENTACFNQIQELTAQVYALERARGWGRRKLRREITSLTGCLFEMDLRLGLQTKRIRELEEEVEEWMEYAMSLEEGLGRG